jgi:hypothetical protein
VEINDAVESIVAILEFNPLFDSAKVISEMERIACWLDA